LQHFQDVRFIIGYQNFLAFGIHSSEIYANLIEI
jgi:hypothetical protein